MTLKGIDSRMIRKLARILDETHLTELEVESDGARIRVARSMPINSSTISVSPGQLAAGPAPAPTHQPPPPPAVNEKTEVVPATNPGTVSAPMVGTVYIAPEPGATPFIRVGDMVTEGQTCIIISAMKMMNHINSPRDGTITHIYVNDGDPVEFGAPLFAVS